MTIFGVSGFLGRYVVNRLGREGWSMRAATRGDDMEIRHLKPLADYGRLVPHYYHPKDEASIVACVPPGTDVVLNLVGKTYDTKHALPWWVNSTLEETNIEVTRRVARVARRQGVKHFVQMSCARAHPEAASRWARTKAAGEQAALDEFPGATIVRPGQLYGEEDRFLNFWAWCVKKLPVVPLIEGSQSTELRPVFVGDVAEALGVILGDWERFAGERVDLLGADSFRLKQIVDYIGRTITGTSPRMIEASSKGPLAQLARAIELLPNPFITRDALELAKCSDLASSKIPALTFADVGIKPHPFETKAFNYLHRYRAGGHFVELRDVEKVEHSGAPAHVSHQISATSATATSTRERM